MMEEPFKTTEATVVDGEDQDPVQTTVQNRKKKLCTLLDLCVSSLRRGHANLLCIAARGKRLIRVFLDAVRE